MIKLWRLRWSESSRVARYGFWLALGAAVMVLVTTRVWVSLDYSGPWDRISDVAIAIMFVGMAVQFGGQRRDRRERWRARR